MVPDGQTVRQHPEEGSAAMPLHLLQGGLGLLRQGQDPPLALLQPQDADVGALALPNSA